MKIAKKRLPEIARNAAGWIHNHERSLADILVGWDGSASLYTPAMLKEVGALVALRGLFTRDELNRIHYGR